MAFGPAPVTDLTAITIDSTTLFPCSKASARNEIPWSEVLLGVGGNANTFTAAQTVSKAGAASVSAVVLSGTPFAGTGTTSFPLLYLNESTATASTTLPTAGTEFGINTHGSQDFVWFGKDGAKKFGIDQNGSIDMGSTASLTIGGQRFLLLSGGSMTFGSGGSNADFVFSSLSAGTILTLTATTGVSTFTLPAAASLILKANASRTAALQKFQTSAAGSLGNVSGGCIDDTFAVVSTTHTDGTFDTLKTTTTVANALIVNGDKIAFDYTLTVVSSATATRDFKLQFAGITIFDSTAQTYAATGTVRITGYITRVSSTTAVATVRYEPSGSATLVGFATTTFTGAGTLTGLTLTGTNNLVLSAAAASTGAASGDINLQQATVSIVGFGS